MGNNDPKALVIDEDFAFGLVDVTDRPKYDLVNKVRAANIAALQSIGLLPCSASHNSHGDGDHGPGAPHCGFGANFAAGTGGAR